MQLDDYTKSVLSDEKLLRSKLLIYFKKPEAVEYYAKTAILAFNAGEQKELKKVRDWSWWGFFYGWIFLWYRKSSEACNFFALSLVFGFLFALSTANANAREQLVLFVFGICVSLLIANHLGKYSKFYIIEEFIYNLKRSNGDDALLATYGETNTFALIFGVIVSPVLIPGGIFLLSFPFLVILSVIIQRLATS